MQLHPAATVVSDNSTVVAPHCVSRANETHTHTHTLPHTLHGLHTALPPTSAQVHFSSSQPLRISSDAPSLSHPCPHECTHSPARRHDRPPRPTFLPDGKLLWTPQERRTTLITMTRRPRGVRRPCQRQWLFQSGRAARADTVFKLSPLSPSRSSLSSTLFLLLRLPLLHPSSSSYVTPTLFVHSLHCSSFLTLDIWYLYLQSLSLEGVMNGEEDGLLFEGSDGMDRSTMVENKSSKQVVIMMKPRRVWSVCGSSKITKERDISHTFVDILFRVQNREVIP